MWSKFCSIRQRKYWKRNYKWLGKGCLTGYAKETARKFKNEKGNQVKDMENIFLLDLWRRLVNLSKKCLRCHKEEFEDKSYDNIGMNQ